MYDKRLSKLNNDLLNNCFCSNSVLDECKCKLRLNLKCDYCDISNKNIKEQNKFILHEIVTWLFGDSNVIVNECAYYLWSPHAFDAVSTLSPVFIVYHMLSFILINCIWYYKQAALWNAVFKELNF